MKKTLTILIVCYLGTNLFAQTNQHLSTIRQADQLYEQGMNQYKSGNYTAAIQRFDQSLTLEKEFSHESDPRYQNLLMWKAGCLYKQGKIDQAKAVSPDYYLIPPIDRAKTAVADSLALQAQAMLASGNAPKALTILQSEAELEKKIIGAKHVLYANTLRNMADVYLMCGDGKSALPYYQAYKEIIAPVYGTRSKFYAAAINGISAGYTYDSARWNEAAKLHEQAQTIYDSLNIAEQERAYLPAIVLSTPAIDNYKSKNFPKAILLLSIIKDNDLIPEKERLLAKQIYGKANGSVASKLFSKNDYQSSIPYFEKSILYADSAAKAISSLELGLCYFHLKRYQTARNLFLQTETYANDEATKQMAYRFIGNAYYYESYPFEASQEYGNALKGYLAALNWFKKGGKPSAYVQALRNVAGIYNNTGEWEKSDSLYQIALQLALTAGDTMGIARTYFDIGCSYLKKSDYNQALKCFDNCYQRCLSIHDYPFALATLSRKVNLYLYNLNNDYMAFMCEKQCEELLKFMDPAQLTTFLPSLFSIQKDMQLNKGDYQGALASLEKLHAARRASIESKNGSVLDSIAEYPLYLKEKINLLHHLKRNDEIRSCIDSLLVAQKGYSPEKLAEESTSIGAIHLMIGDHEAAVADLKKSIQLFRQVDNNERRCEQSYYYMGIAYANLKKYTEAQTALEKALSINQSVKPAYNKDKEDILCTLANACAFGNNPAIAQSYYTQTVDVLKTIVKRDFAFLTEQERNGYWNTLQTDLQHFSAFGYKMNTFDCPFTTELYNAVLFSKGLLINSDNEVSRLVSKNPVLTVMQHELNSLQQEIESKQQKGLNTDSLRLKRQKKEAEMLEKCTGLYGNYTQFLSIDFKDVVARLGEKDVALEFHDFKCGKDSTMYCAFILKPGMSNPKMVPLFEKKTLDSLQLAPSLTFASAFSYGSKEDHDTIYQSKELGQLIWGKILPFLNDGQHVYFSPTGIFYQLGIENLPLEDNQPFSDHYTVYRLSSTRELATATTVSSDGKAVLYGGLQYDEDAPTMADMSHRNRRKQDFSDYSTLAYEGNRSLSDLTKHRDGGKTGPVPSTRDDGEVTSLPYTKEEVTEINAQLTSPASKNALRTTMYTGTGGNEESFKALSGTHPRILHIATHGFFLPQYEAEAFYDQRSFLMGINEQQKADAEVSLSRSGLLLAGASKAWNGEVIPDSIDDGILTAKEIAHMDLKGTDLVVLSACETGLGDVTGDGVFGLQRGFKKAGVNTLVMSLWKVDDKATKIFMTQFYANLMNGQSKRTAFLNAQKFLRDYHSPAGQSNGTSITPYASPEYWAAFILLDGIH